MPEVENATERAARLVTELKVSGHLMTLDPGCYCIVNHPSRPGEPGAGLPGVRLSPPPGPAGRPEAVTIRTFREDGWLQGGGDAALVRVLGGPAQVMVTIYQAPGAESAAAPNLQVVRLLEGAARAARAAPGGKPEVVDVLAHIRTRGDVGGHLGAWVGERGSKLWIEGFAVAPAAGIPADDIEYQAVLGRGWLSPWVEGGQFCGSRGMALPILGLRLRLRGATAETHECSYAATFVDGTSVGPVGEGEPCEAESLAPVEAFTVSISPRGALPAAPPKQPAVAERAPERPPPVRPAPRAAAAPKVSPARPGQRPSPAKPAAKGKPARRGR